jgi:hypothetical protein
MKISKRQLRRIIREAIEGPSIGSPMIDKIKKLGTVDPVQAFMIAKSFPDFERMDLSFLQPGLFKVVVDNIMDQIPEDSYPEVETSAHGYDIGLEFTGRPKRFHAADGMNLTDAQVEERKKQEQDLADLALSSIEEYSDLIKSEFASIDQKLVAEDQSEYGTYRKTTVRTMLFTLIKSEVVVEIETFKNTLDIRIQAK